MDVRPIEQRKRDHLEPFRGPGVPAREASTWLSCVHLIHQALPELDLRDVDLTVDFLGHRLRAPLWVTGMTGGTPEARRINQEIARVCDDLGIAFGLGSQRAMVVDPSTQETYQVREVAPTVLLAGNLGGVQLARMPLEAVRRLIDDVGADALCVHLNPAQELAQPEGDRDFRGIAEAIARACRELPVPVIVKEVGCGISREAARRLVEAGVSALDVAGTGGTSWVGLEIGRGPDSGEPDPEAFWDWGIPTAAAIVEAEGMGVPLIASGGIRTALDALRALALGATMVGLAAPVIQAWFQGGQDAVRRRLASLIDWIARGMLLTGARNLAELRNVPRVLLPPLADFVRERRTGLIGGEVR
ncbi:MAG TPA: type 2 isopentenyl-diphosphate Delta-isomerase [Myxococcota bacterium]|nr:type 2 isopentenyl-diphosphate Delta-isomerase [Myxococcota bacterium]HQK51704.1 type 2 isopentenyl-diphosphate Delta-isomerase [Myxococcota bacterium]